MKEKVLEVLKSNAPGYTSGEDISRLLGVSRTAIWKHISELKREGYCIEASSRKGYRLIPGEDPLNGYEIGYGLKTEMLGKKTIYLPTVDSTNSYAKRAAFEGCEEGTLVVADTQTAGRGRLDRDWVSDAGKGIWMSVILKPHIAPEEVQIITLGAAVAVTAAIKKTTGIEAGIKWPNDIILDGKKVCGILTEMNSEMERINYIVLGIGINVGQDAVEFPAQLQNSATSLKVYSGEVFSRREIIQNLLYELERIYSKIKANSTAEILEEWRSRSVTLGREVTIVSRTGEFSGVARDITPDGKLVVQGRDGTLREINSGEVSIRGLLGYT